MKAGRPSGSKPARSVPSSPKPSSRPSSGGSKPSRSFSPSPKPSHDPGPKIRPSSGSKTSFLQSLNTIRMGKVNKPPRPGGLKTGPGDSVGGYIQEDTVEQTSGESTGRSGCGCLPGCALGTLGTIAALVTVLLKLL